MADERFTEFEKQVGRGVDANSDNVKKKNSKTMSKTKEGDSDSEVPFYKKLSVAGQYAYSCTCAVSLYQLFEEDWHTNFKIKTQHALLCHLDQPAQVCESVYAIMKGHGIDEAGPFVTVVLEDLEDMSLDGLAIITDLLSISIRGGCYDARTRILIKHIAWLMRVNWDRLEELEAELANSLDVQSYKMSQEELNEKAKQERKNKAKRFALIGLATVGGGTLIGEKHNEGIYVALIGLATVGGGTLIGLTGGLAAPFVAAGAGALIGGTSAAVLGSAVGVAIIGSLFGVAGAGLTGYKMKRRVGAIEEFEFQPLVGGSQLQMTLPPKQLHITIAITGWLSDTIQDCKQPWQCLAESKEQYCLKWETKYLLALGKALDYILSAAMSVATQEALKYTVLSGLLTAVAWPAALISAATMIDNPWSVCTQRATAAGKQLAEVLLAREQGKRPVTLIGFSLGARLIFACIEEMAKRKGSEGIVEDVILLGAPVSGDPKHWSPLARVISGKIINGYCRGDWLLKFLYRTASVQMKVAGLGPVKWNNRRMHNIDLSDMVVGHKDYFQKLDEILSLMGIRIRSDIVSIQESGHIEGNVSDTDNKRDSAIMCETWDSDNNDVVIVERTSTEDGVMVKSLDRHSFVSIDSISDDSAIQSKAASESAQDYEVQLELLTQSDQWSSKHSNSSLDKSSIPSSKEDTILDNKNEDKNVASSKLSDSTTERKSFTSKIDQQDDLFETLKPESNPDEHFNFTDEAYSDFDNQFVTTTNIARQGNKFDYRLCYLDDDLFNGDEDFESLDSDEMISSLNLNRSTVEEKVNDK